MSAACVGGWLAGWLAGSLGSLARCRQQVRPVRRPMSYNTRAVGRWIDGTEPLLTMQLAADSGMDHTLEALNFVPCLYLTLSYAMMRRSPQCGGEAYDALFGADGVHYASPCDVYAFTARCAPSRAGACRADKYWLLASASRLRASERIPHVQAANIVSLSGAIGILTEVFLGGRIHLQQYLWCCVVGLVAVWVVLSACWQLYAAAKSYESWIESRSSSDQDRLRAESEHMVFLSEEFLVLFLSVNFSLLSLFGRV